MIYCGKELTIDIKHDTIFSFVLEKGDLGKRVANYQIILKSKGEKDNESRNEKIPYDGDHIKYCCNCYADRIKCKCDEQAKNWYDTFYAHSDTNRIVHGF